MTQTAIRTELAFASPSIEHVWREALFRMANADSHDKRQADFFVRLAAWEQVTQARHSSLVMYVGDENWLRVKTLATGENPRRRLVIDAQMEQCSNSKLVATFEQRQRTLITNWQCSSDRRVVRLEANFFNSALNVVGDMMLRCRAEPWYIGRLTRMILDGADRIRKGQSSNTDEVVRMGRMLARIRPAVCVAS